MAINHFDRNYEQMMLMEEMYWQQQMQNQMMMMNQANSCELKRACAPPIVSQFNDSYAPSGSWNKEKRLLLCS